MPDRRLWRSAVAGVALVICAAMMLSAQAPTGRETFDTVSIREAQRGSTARPLTRVGPANFSATNSTALNLIQYVFRIPETHVVNLPDWAKSTRFDVVARAAGEPLTQSRLVAMVQALLEDRFRLNTSVEQVTMPAYALVLTRSDGSRGPNLRSSASKCEVDPLVTPTPEGLVKALVFVGCGLGHGTSGGWLSMMTGARVTMDQFAAHLSRWGGFDRPVVNRTGLSGDFDLTVLPTAEMPGATSDARFLVGLREQLGMTLRPEQLPVDVLRIHRIERPSEN
jgi:uncharacterized protein (TIGR03435 family)